jgi:hypothetical protein
MSLELLILGEMVNLQKVNLPKTQPGHKITKMLCLPKTLFGVFSGLTFFGKLTFWSVDFLEVDHFS